MPTPLIIGIVVAVLIVLGVVIFPIVNKHQLKNMPYDQQIRIIMKSADKLHYFKNISNGTKGTLIYVKNKRKILAYPWMLIDGKMLCTKADPFDKWDYPEEQPPFTEDEVQIALQELEKYNKHSAVKLYLQEKNDMNLPNDAKMLISLFEQNGHSAYAVGGCVRDALMGVAEKDIDITTSATPEQTESILSANNIKFVETGIKHGTVTALVNHIPYEITTFRTDGDYVDNRHPDSVNFVDDVTLDLARRDFTMNAIAYNDSKGFVDCFGGMDDIKNKIIRAVGDPDKRFEEDALRIMRCIRFASVLGFDIEENTSRAVFDNKELLKNIAAERIYIELVKLLMGDNAEAVLLKYKDVIGVIIPELVPTFTCDQVSKWHIYDVYTHIVKSVAVAPKKDYIRLALLFHDIAKPQTKTTDKNGNDHFKFHGFEGVKIAENVLKRLRVSNDIYKKVTELVKYHDDRITTKPSNIKKWLRVFGEDMIFDYIDLKIADLSTHNLIYAQEEIDALYQIKNITADIIASHEPYRVCDLAITGKDLIELGYTGHQIAEELDFLVKIVSGNPRCNTKEKLIHQALSDIKSNA